MKKEIHDEIKVLSARNLAAITSNTTSAGNIIDTAGHESLEFLIYSNALTDGVFTPLIAVGNAADLSDAVTVSSDATKILGTVAGATFISTDDNVVKKIGVRADGYRYARLSIVSTGVTSGGTLGAVAVLAHATIKPVA